MCNPSRSHFIVLQVICILFIGVTSWFYIQRTRHHKENPIGLYKGSGQPAPFPPYNGSYAKIVHIPDVHIKEADCKGLFEGKIDPSRFASLNKESWHSSEAHLINITSDCKSYIKSRKYIMKPISSEEANFPLAFTLVVYKNADQIEQLLRAIYRTQNYYCIHVDLHAVDMVYRSISKIASCFENVFLASRRYHVTWGMFTVLQPEFQCMEDLLNRRGWRYLINLTGQEFPLKTNEDIVRILKVYNGSNAIGFNMWDNHKHTIRIKFKYASVNQVIGNKGPPPHKLKITQGSVHMALTRAFVDYALHHQVARDFINWVNDTRIPDETFFQSLQVNPYHGVPGAFTGNLWEKYEDHQPYTRYKRWYECSKTRKKIRDVCILGVYDMVTLHKAPDMFANKFFPYFHPLARMCLEERIMNRTREQLQGKAKLDLTPYKILSFVKNHAPS